ncbi:hypothetical protein [Chengkuizengella axinellae]|uniref:Uncharacterized protein n=1 Tax=Chengkuizengella axinellae TaxID=3064388 RepID=A0ABT9J6D9_9BACL|nr:hypothetical protein [Chengkuizengella sp. 2205SS18-9]MDP5277113.1 hypothetical protein [Chengkuizengella sp. 2205SS18-9]
MCSRIKGFINYFTYKLGSNAKNYGTTTFAPLRIIPQYTNIDLKNRQVTGLVKYNNKVYLTVIVDVHNRKTKVKGNLRGITKITKPFKKSHYIEMIKNEAENLIKNKIENPK